MMINRCLAALLCLSAVLTVRANVNVQTRALDDESPLSVTVTDAGTLPTLITDEQKTTTASLVVNGPLNGVDLKFLRSMVTGGALRDVDMSGASIVTDPDTSFVSYYGTPYYAQAGVFPAVFYQTSIQRVVMPTSVTSVALRALSDCGQLTKVVMPDGLTDIGAFAFACCTQLLDISIPDGVTAIKERTFYHCDKLESITLPSSLQTIGDEAFYYCRLYMLSLPNGLVSIGNYAFQYSSLQFVYFPSSLRSIGNYAFANCGSLYNNLQGIVLPQGLTTLGNNVFYYCRSLRSVKLPNSITSMGSGLFFGCEKLNQVTLPADLAVMGTGMFQGCTSLTSLTIPTAITTLPSSTFYGCTSLTSVGLHDGITTIGGQAFDGCTALTELALPAHLQKVEVSAFRGSGIRSLVLPETVNSLASNIFAECPNLESVTLPSGLTRLPNQLFDKCPKLTTVNIPAGVTSLPDYLFRNCTSLAHVTLPASLTSIGSDCFYGCSSLQNLDLPATLTSLGSSVFSGCKSFTAITLPEGLTTLPYATFQNCTRLADVQLPSTLTRINSSAFEGCTSLAALTLPDALTTLDGQGIFRDCTALRSISLPDAVTTVGPALFNGCKSLTDVHISTSLTALSQSMFSGCTSLGQVTIPDGVRSLGQGCFYGCTSLTSVNIPAGVTALPSQCFQNCTSLPTVTLPTSITNIGQNAFNSCTALTDINLPEGLMTIQSTAFDKCTSLRSIHFPSTLTTLGQSSFNQCAALTEVYVPANVTRMDCYYSAGVFTYCDNLTLAVVDANLTSWGPHFLGCSKLKSLYLPATLTGTDYYGIRNTYITDLHIKAVTPPSASQSQGQAPTTLYVPRGSAEAYRANQYYNQMTIVEEDYTFDALDDAEWAVLRQIPADTDGPNWKRQWNLSESKTESSVPYGVTVSDGHVTSLSLSGNQLCGTLPVAVFSLPKLHSLNLDGNQLTGNLTTLAASVAQNDSLRLLDLSDNQLTGNLTPLAERFPNLTDLRVKNNRIRDISPVLSDHITNLEYTGQDLTDITFTWPDLLNHAALPSLMRYNHVKNGTSNYSNSCSLYLRDTKVESQRTWGISYSWYLTNDNYYPTYYNYYDKNGWYTLPAGTEVYASNSGNIIRVKMDFDAGDVNFDNRLKVDDLQKLLNYALSEIYWERKYPFNFTAANLIDDDNVINVQDVVAEVNLLLDADITPTFSVKGRNMPDRKPTPDPSLKGEEISDEAEEAVAWLEITDGQLILTTVQPLSAFEFVLSDGRVEWTDALQWFTKAERQQAEGRRVLFYSLFGDELPAGRHVLATLDADVIDAAFSDLDARLVPMAIGSGDATGIEDMKNESLKMNHSDAIYDLQGRRVAVPAQGLYIVNGEKVKMK